MGGIRSTALPELRAEERAMPISKYYHRPILEPGPMEKQLLDGCPINSRDAIRVEDFLDLLDPDDYMGVELGFCRMPDRSGYIASYAAYPSCSVAMLEWWDRWQDARSLDMPRGGNLKYKISNPLCHIDRGYVNGCDSSSGVFKLQSAEAGDARSSYYSISYPVDLGEYGLSREREELLRTAGCHVDCAVEKFFSKDPSHRSLPGTRLAMTMTRMCAAGGAETRTRAWIGYGVENGTIYLDQATPEAMLTEDHMGMVLYRGFVAARRLNQILPELYAAYKDRPLDQW